MRMNASTSPSAWAMSSLRLLGADPIITNVHSLCCSSRMFTWIIELEALSLAIAEVDPRWNR